MILAIDMGNTNIVMGCVDGKETLFVERMATDSAKMVLDYAISMRSVLEFHEIKKEQIDGVIISSVVPPLLNTIKKAVHKVLGLECMVVSRELDLGLPILMDNPSQVGADLLVDAVAVVEEYGAPAIVIDMGTATTLSVIDKDGNYVGGQILPGVHTATNALVSNAAQLSKISLEPPKTVIGKNTADCIKSGVVLGNAACVDGMIDRIWEELGYETTVVATGGISALIIPQCRHRIMIDDALLLKGLKLIYDKNCKSSR